MLRKQRKVLPFPNGPDSRIGLTLALLAASLLLPRATGAQPQPGQVIRGRVMVAGDTLPLANAEVSLSDSLGSLLSQTVSDSKGRFSLHVPRPGSFRIRAWAMGYTTSRARIRVREKEVVEVEFRLALEPITLEPLLISARRQIRPGTPDEFYDRMARMQEEGKGQFLTVEEIENFGGLEIAILLQTLPGVYASAIGRGGGYSVEVRSRGELCTPQFFLDGIPMGISRNIFAMDLEGVEVYREPFEEVDSYWTTECGSIFLWRKEDWGIPFTMIGFGLALAAATVWLLIPGLF